MNAAQAACLDAAQSPRRFAALLESQAAEQQFLASIVGAHVWVRADEEVGGLVRGQVCGAYQRGDVRTEHGVACWGRFCPASFPAAKAQAFFAQAQQRSAVAYALP